MYLVFLLSSLILLIYQGMPLGIFTILVEFLCIEHIDYALETGLAGKYVYLYYSSS